MSTKSTVVRSIDLTENELYFYQEQGYLTIPNLIEPSVVEALHEAVLDVLATNGTAP